MTLHIEVKLLRPVFSQTFSHVLLLMKWQLVEQIIFKNSKMNTISIIAGQAFKIFRGKSEAVSLSPALCVKYKGSCSRKPSYN